MFSDTGELSFREVLKTYVRQGAPIVLVTLMAIDPAMGSTLTTIETTDEHPFLVEATANGDPAGWTRVDDLSPGDTIKQFDGLSPGSVVVSVQFTSRREQVHNLEVEGLHTYLVGADGVVVHNGYDVCFIGYPWKKLQHLYKHATDFGLSGNWNINQGKIFANALIDHKARAQALPGVYRGNNQGTHFYEASTGLWQFVGLDGNVIAAMKLGAGQVSDLFTKGHVW